MLKAFFILGSLLCACIFLPIETTIAVDNQCMCKCDSSHPLSEVDSSTGAGETTMPDEDIGETTEDAFGNDAGDLESSPLEEISNESGSELGATDSLTLFVDQCKSNADCASNQYCLNESHKISCENTSSCDTSAKCVPRRTLGQNCTSDQFCSQALHCWVQAQCVQREKLGEKCEYPRYPKVQSPCEDGLECSSATAKCIATGVRKKGEKCFFDSNQCEQESLFCNDVCETKKLPGAICGFIRGECANGVCANYFGSDVGLNRPYTCVSQPFCTSSLSCPGEMDINVGSNVDAPQVLCNLATGKLYGLCLNETMLTKTLGASCDPAFDTCDARRNLVCDTLNGQPRCLQRDGHCTPGSPFSSCSSKETGVAMECRRPLTQETKKPFGKNACSRKLEIIKLGNLCSLEDYAICEEGASCEMPPGVSVHNPGDCVAQSPGAAESPLCSGRNAKYCMRTIPTGSDCSSVFTTKCEKGSFCINAKCVKSNSEPIVPLQYAGFEQGCETEKPNVCAPGLECGTADFAGQLVCVKPKIVVGENDLCVSNSTHEIVCGKEFSCSLPKNNDGTFSKRCQRGPGGDCQGSDCAEGLQCAIQSLGGGFRCTDPKGLARGKPCDPNEGFNGNCGIVAFEPPNLPDGLHCLPKEGSYACQRKMEILQDCSPGKNRACAEGLVCDSVSSLCLLPKSVTNSLSSKLSSMS